MNTTNTGIGGVTKIYTNAKQGVQEIISAPILPWDSVQKVFIGIIFFLAIGAIGYGIWWATQPPPNINIVQELGKRKAELAKKYSNLNANKSLYQTVLNQIDPLEQYLVNLQPLTAHIGGFIGPTESGVFDVEWYVQNALRMGIRSFVLPISTYIDDNKKFPYWPSSGKPAIVYRDTNGVIKSLNGLTIKKFCETLQLYTNENPLQAKEPILLHIVPIEGYVPDPVKDEKRYVMLMKDIAEELKTINNQRLMTIGSFGSALGGQKEIEILTQIPLKDMMEKILVFTTFDVKVALKDSYKDISPKLYEFANFLPEPLTLEAGKMTIQPNVLQGSRTSSASKVIRLTDISGSKVNWMEQARTTLYSTIADSPNFTPTKAEIQGALKVGIQCIPIPFFYNDSTEVLESWKLWGGAAWKVKEKDARFRKPAPIVPAPPNPKFNARVDNKLQPGQVKV